MSASFIRATPETKQLVTLLMGRRSAVWERRVEVAKKNVQR